MLPIALFVLSQALGPNSYASSYDSCSGVTVSPKNSQELQQAQQWATTVLNDRIRVAPTKMIFCGSGLTQLQSSNIEHKINARNLGSTLRREHQRLQNTRTRGLTPDNWFDDFRDFETIQTYIHDLVARFPHLLREEVIGTSLEGRPIIAVHVRPSDCQEKRPGSLVIGTQHAREWISPMVVLYTLTQLAEGYADNPEIRKVLDQVDIFMVPVVNPDGYAYTWADDGDRYWRKNRRPNSDGTFGVDLNRNWGQGWGLDVGSDSEPSSYTYRGTSAFSEPETAAIQNFIQQHPEIKSFIDFHSFSQVVIHDPGYYYAPMGRGHESECISKAISRRLTQHQGAFYTSIPGPHFYPVTGASTDWVGQTTDGIAITIELPPPANGEEGDFVVDPSRILPAGRENLVAVLDMANLAKGTPPPGAHCEPDLFHCAAICHSDFACSEETDLQNHESQFDWDLKRYDYHGTSFDNCVINCQSSVGQARPECSAARKKLNTCLAPLNCSQLAEAEACADLQDQEQEACAPPPRGPCGWLPQGYYACGGDGPDPSGDYPMECPANLVEGEACDFQDVGCCDPDGNAWYCFDQGSGVDQAYKDQCVEGNDDDDDVTPDPGDDDGDDDDDVTPDPGDDDGDDDDDDNDDVTPDPGDDDGEVDDLLDLLEDCNCTMPQTKSDHARAIIASMLLLLLGGIRRRRH